MYVKLIGVDWFGWADCYSTLNWFNFGQRVDKYLTISNLLLLVCHCTIVVHIPLSTPLNLIILFNSEHNVC